MKVADGLVVRCEYDLRVAGGEVLESSSKTGPIEYTHGTGKMLAALEKELVGMEAGEERKGVIKKVAFGSAAPTLAVPRTLFPKDAKLEVGAMFEAKDPEGRPLRLEIRTVTGDQISARAVHPLEGLDLEYRVKVLSVRTAPPPVPVKSSVELAADDLEIVEE